MILPFKESVRLFLRIFVTWPIEFSPFRWHYLWSVRTANNRASASERRHIIALLAPYVCAACCLRTRLFYFFRADDSRSGLRIFRPIILSGQVCTSAVNSIPFSMTGKYQCTSRSSCQSILSINIRLAKIFKCTVFFTVNSVRYHNAQKNFKQLTNTHKQIAK